MRTIIKGGVLAGHDMVFKADISFENGRIVEMGENLPADNAEIIDADNCIVMPGAVDAHTHLDLSVNIGGREVGVSDGYYAGTLAAVYGGTTTVANHPGFGPDGCPLLRQAEESRKKAEGQAVADFAVHSVFQRFDEDLAGQLPEAIKAGYATGKFYMTYAQRLEDRDALEAMNALGSLGGLGMAHCENNEILNFLKKRMVKEGRTGVRHYPESRPDYAESGAVGRIFSFCRLTGARTYVVHLSTRAGLKIIESARAEGLPLLAETCPQYLLLDESCYQEGDIEALKYVMAPPLRTSKDISALWDGLKNGLIQVVGTDHCSFNFKDKAQLSEGDIFKCPGGAPGIETRVPLLFSEGVLKGRLTLPRFVSVACEAPARILGLKNKGRLAPGYDADLVTLDPAIERIVSVRNLHQQSDYTPFEGMQARGWPRDVWLRGMRLINNGEFVGEKGCGRFVPTNICS